MQNRMIHKTVKRFLRYEIDEQPLSEVVAKLTAISAEHPNAYIDVDVDEHSIEFMIRESRLETNQERKAREQAEHESELNRKRALLKQLKDELGEE